MFLVEPRPDATARRCPHPPSRLRFGAEVGEAVVACRWCGETGPAAVLLPGWAARWSARAAAAALDSLDAEMAQRRVADLAEVRALLRARAAGLRAGPLHGGA